MNNIKPGKVFFDDKATGNQWGWTIVHPTRGEFPHVDRHSSAFLAKQRMREFVTNWNNDANKGK